MKNLSKSRYTAFRQCPKNLWMKIYKPWEAEEDPAVEARFVTGNMVGDLAMGLFGEFDEVTTFDAEGRLDLTAMVKKTAMCLMEEVENIAEASFSWDGNYCAVDILHKQDGGYAIYEVKSSTNSVSKPKKLKDLEHYAWDIAYQKYVLENCGINVTDTYLVQLNSDYVRGEELNIHELFHITDMKELVAEELIKVPYYVKLANQLLESTDEPDNPLSISCSKPYKCAFWKYCSKNVPVPSVFDLYRMPFNKALTLYNAGIQTFDDVHAMRLTAMQRMQVECELNHSEHIDKNGIATFLRENIHYPLYFLDFETMQDVIPQYKGTKPYQQITFQYSLHWIEKEGATLKHEEFLGESGTDPRRALAEQICKDIPMDVCVTAYNKSFECTRLQELANAYPDLSNHLLNIKKHIVDFLDPFQAGYYYTPAMQGSFSIKKVLPALFPNDPKLDYHNLAGNVQNGGEAMTIFPMIKDMPDDEKRATRESLLRYCELDTLAMVKVWEKLVEVSKKIERS